jgi:glutamyl-tRNA synthetase
MVKVRFAPSPTGYLHIGGARTALFNWLYACSQSGKFVLRIEDTDTKRSQKEYLDEILDSLSWLGFAWDEIYYQSQRFAVYRDYAEQLLKQGAAYRAASVVIEEAGEDDTEPVNSASLAPQEAIIFKVTPRKIIIRDLIHGPIEFDTTVIKDQVLIKSDGSPTYNFACVVDDASMGITHVIRGDDHISNTPKQVLLYEALGFKLPDFAHLPLILGKGGGRLSKRTGATAISDYRRMGYLPEALANYLLLLGWSPGGNREVIDIKEATRLFDIKKANKTAAVFDIEKLNWINSRYIKKEPVERLFEIILPDLLENKYVTPDKIEKTHIIDIIKLFQNRLSTLKDFIDWADFFFIEDIKIDPEAQDKFLACDFSREFKLFLDRLDALEKYDVATIEDTFRQMVKELNIEAKTLIHPIRVALSGKTVGPGLFEIIYYLGKERVKKRLLRWVKEV